MTLIVFIPLVQALFTTFTDIDRANQGTRFKPPSWEFVGLQNYIDILSGKDRFFYPTLIWTIVWTIVNVFFHYTLGLHPGAVSSTRSSAVGRATGSCSCCPGRCRPTSAAIAWLFIFNGEYGLLNNILTAPRASTGVNWLSSFPWYYISPDHRERLAGRALHDGGPAGRPADDPRRPVRGRRRWTAPAAGSRFWNITLPGLRTRQLDGHPAGHASGPSTSSRSSTS